MRLRERRPPDLHLPCPKCGPGRQEVRNRKREVLGVWKRSGGREQVYCIRCGFKGLRNNDRVMSNGAPVGVPSGKSRTASFLWSKSVLASGTPVERYLKIGRGIGVSTPIVVRYLPQRENYPHAMITAFGQNPLCDGVRAIHLTRLSDDGLRRLDKRMFGPVSGLPLALAPIAADKILYIVEGIEDGLAVYQATGCGVWAAGSSIHMKGLAAAIAHIDCKPVILADSDKAGIDGAGRLVRALAGLGVSADLKVLCDD